MMLYRIIETFGPHNGKRWSDYIHWRGLTRLTRCDSVDGILRPSLFVPETDQDWRTPSRCPLSCPQPSATISLVI